MTSSCPARGRRGRVLLTTASHFEFRDYMKFSPFCSVEERKAIQSVLFGGREKSNSQDA